MLFALDRETSAYIERQGGSVVIDYKFRACFGDGLLTSRRLLGSFVPAVRLGRPADSASYACTSLDGITLYFPAALRPKAGLQAVRIVRKGFFAWHWLELEGARLTPVFDD